MDRSEAESAAADEPVLSLRAAGAAGSRYSAVIDGARRPMCCAGCQAVAQAIAGRLSAPTTASRTALSRPRRGRGRGATSSPSTICPRCSASFVRASAGAREADAAARRHHLRRLRLAERAAPGASCPACCRSRSTTPRSARACAGIPAADRAVRRSCVRSRRSAIAPSRVSRATAEQARKRENRAALWRLFVAGFGMMQVMMYAVPAYLARGRHDERRHRAADARWRAWC